MKKLRRAERIPSARMARRSTRKMVRPALSSWPGTMILVSHDVGFVQALEPDRVLLMPEAQNEPWEQELLDLVTLA